MKKKTDVVEAINKISQYIDVQSEITLIMAEAIKMLQIKLDKLENKVK